MNSYFFFSLPPDLIFLFGGVLLFCCCYYYASADCIWLVSLHTTLDSLSEGRIPNYTAFYVHGFFFSRSLSLHSFSIITWLLMCFHSVSLLNSNWFLFFRFIRLSFIILYKFIISFWQSVYWDDCGCNTIRQIVPLDTQLQFVQMICMNVYVSIWLAESVSYAPNVLLLKMVKYSFYLVFQAFKMFIYSTFFFHIVSANLVCFNGWSKEMFHKITKIESG